MTGELIVGEMVMTKRGIIIEGRMIMIEELTVGEMIIGVIMIRETTTGEIITPEEIIPISQMITIDVCTKGRTTQISDNEMNEIIKVKPLTEGPKIEAMFLQV
jgi:hypothetical protein